MIQKHLPLSINRPPKYITIMSGIKENIYRSYFERFTTIYVNHHVLCQRLLRGKESYKPELPRRNSRGEEWILLNSEDLRFFEYFLHRVEIQKRVSRIARIHKTYLNPCK